MWLLVSCNKESKNAREKIYVANELEGTISVLNADTYKEIKKIDLSYKGEMYKAHNVDVTPDGKYAMATAVPHSINGEEFLMLMNSKNDKVKKRIRLGKDQHLSHVVIDANSSMAYVTAYDPGQLIVVSLIAENVSKRIDLGKQTGPHGLRILGKKVYIACLESKELLEVDVLTNQIKRTYLDGVAVQTAVFDKIPLVCVSLYDKKQIVKYNTQTGDTNVISLPLDSQGPIQIYPSKDNTLLYVCDQGILDNRPYSNKVYVIDVNSNQVIKTIEVGKGAHGVTTNDAGSKLFITNIFDNTVSVIDASSYEVLQTITVGVSPNGIAHLINPYK